MRYLLDTHVFIWWVTDCPKLSLRMREEIEKPTNQLFLSAASTWEMMIKATLKKLTLPEPPEAVIRKHLQLNAVDPLPIVVAHTMDVGSLPNIHRDPFDRMLVAQARCEDLTLMTDDKLIRQYPVQVLI